jgi:hypothetical protein
MDDPADEYREQLEPFLRHWHHVLRSFASSRELERAHPSLNTAIRDFRASLSGKPQKSARKGRAHPFLEIAISKLLSDWGVNDEPSVTDVLRACKVIEKRLKIVRGRPTDSTLAYHVEGLMLLWKELTGKDCKASRKHAKDEYDPRPVSRGAFMIERSIKSIDPTVSRTAIVNCILRGEKRNQGRRFRGMFPFCDGGGDLAGGVPTAGPGFKLDSFGLAHPIYCSVTAPK